MSHFRNYFYVVAYPVNGSKLVVIGPHESAEESNTLGMTKLDVPYSVEELPTRDRGRATAILKSRLLNQSGDLTNALRPSQHKIRSTDNLGVDDAAT